MKKTVFLIIILLFMFCITGCMKFVQDSESYMETSNNNTSESEKMEFTFESILDKTLILGSYYLMDFGE